MLRNFDTASVFKYMFIEFIIGSLIGLIVMQSARFNAQNNVNIRINPGNNYTSRHFGKNFPRHAFDAFFLPPEFVLTKSVSSGVSSEEFYTFLGASTKVYYEDGRYQPHGHSALTSPVYMCTVLIPILIGFFPSFIPFISQYFSPLLYSGVVWMFLTFIIQIVIGTLSSITSNSR